MSGEPVTIEMLKILTNSHNAILKTLAEDLKEVRQEQVKASLQISETNSLLREDINTTKQALNQITIDFNDHKNHVNTRFKQAFKILKSRESVYRAAYYIKWVIGIVLVGALSALGAGIYVKYFGQDSAIEAVEKGKQHELL